MNATKTCDVSTDYETAYRSAVIDAVESGGPEPDAAMLEAAGRLRADFLADCTIYRNRKSAFALQADLPRLEKLAAEAEAKAAKIDHCGNRPVTDYPTIAELSAALFQFATENDPAFVSNEKLAARNLRNDVARNRTEIARLLSESADPEIHKQIETTRKSIDRLRQGITARPTAEKIDEEIAKLRLDAEKLATGKRPDCYSAFGDFRPTKVLLAEVRHNIKLLQTRRESAIESAKQNDRDYAEIGRLEKQLPVLAKSVGKIENMGWSKPM